MADEKYTREDLSNNGMLMVLMERTGETREDTRMLRHVLLEGNGTPSVVSQVATLTSRQEATDAKLDLHISGTTQSKGDRVTLYAALITGALGMLDAILRHLHII